MADPRPEPVTDSELQGHPDYDALLKERNQERAAREAAEARAKAMEALAEWTESRLVTAERGLRAVLDADSWRKAKLVARAALDEDWDAYQEAKGT